MYKAPKHTILSKTGYLSACADAERSNYTGPAFSVLHRTSSMHKHRLLRTAYSIQDLYIAQAWSCCK